MSFFFFFIFYLFMIVTKRERGRDTGRGRSRLHALGARCGIRSQVSRITPWAKGRRQTAAPPRDPRNCVLFILAPHGHAWAWHFGSTYKSVNLQITNSCNSLCPSGLCTKSWRALSNASLQNDTQHPQLPLHLSDLPDSKAEMFSRAM